MGFLLSHCELGESDGDGKMLIAEDFCWDEVDSKFSEQMRMARLTHSQPIAIAVSGGADSIALCLLIARWKRQTEKRDENQQQKSGEMLYAFVVDHSLRNDSADEALRVKHWVCNLGLKCEILKCEWPDGKPSAGHLQEVARNARYSLLSQACRESRVSALLTAHHADDQAELFILRLSRHSDIAGLAGMAFVSELHLILSSANRHIIPSLTLVRPLLQFSKAELYAVCQQSGQDWIEDPTNVNLTFARNRIRRGLQEPHYLPLKKELPKLIKYCRKLRSILDRDRDKLLRDVAQVSQEYGHVTLDVQKLASRAMSDLVTHRTVAAILQYVAQRYKPPRGKAVEMLLSRLRRGNLQGACTVGGCYVFPVPGSKGSRAIICFSPDSPPSLKQDSFLQHLEPIMSEEFGVLDKLRVPFSSGDATGFDESVHDETNFTPVLAEAFDLKRPPRTVKDFETLGLISKVGAGLLEALSSSTARDMSKPMTERTPQSSTSDNRMWRRIAFGQSCYFMERFLISLELNLAAMDDSHSLREYCCLWRQRPSLCIRHFREEDWEYLSALARQSTVPLQRTKESRLSCNLLSDHILRTFPNKQCKQSERQQTGQATADFMDSLTRRSPPQTLFYPSASIADVTSDISLVQTMESGQVPWCGFYRSLSAKGVISFLKSVPMPVRMSLPVVTTAQNLLVGIPLAGFAHCRVMSITSRFCPRNPLGGGRSSWY